MLPADHAAQEMLGGDLAALEIEGVAVGVEGLAAVFGDLAGLPDVAILDVLGDVAEHDILALLAPGGAFRPFEAGLHPLDRAVADETVIGGGIQDQDIGIGIDVGRRVVAVDAAIEDGGQGRQLRPALARLGEGQTGHGCAAPASMPRRVKWNVMEILPAVVVLGWKGSLSGEVCQCGWQAARPLRSRRPGLAPPLWLRALRRSSLSQVHRTCSPAFGATAPHPGQHPGYSPAACRATGSRS